MDPTTGPWRMPYGDTLRPSKPRYLQDSPFFKAIFAITFSIAFIFFLFSIYALFDPSHSSDFSSLSPVYFFVLLLASPLIPVNTLLLAVIMVVLFAAFFLSIFYLGAKRWNGPSLENPIIFYGAMASFAYLLTLIVTFIELAAGIPIGGTSIETGIQQHPYLSYIQLIYAPFTEELGFRIIPLGLFSVFLVARSGGTFFDSASAFLLPGFARKRFGIKLTKIDYILIFATSFIWGSAHYLFGAWDPGKIVSATIVGIILAYGFLKFGVFMDIPIHWLFNGFATVYIIYPPMSGPAVLGILWVVISGAVGLVYILIVAIDRKRVVQDRTLELPPGPLT